MFSIFKKSVPITYSYDDVTLIPAYSQLSSRKQADPEMHGYRLPIISSCMDTLGSKEMIECCIKNKIPYICCRTFKTAEQQFYNFFTDFEWNEKYTNVDLNCVWFAVGSVQKYKEWIDYLYNKGVRRFCVDMAHGDSIACVDTIKYIKSLFNNSAKKSYSEKKLQDNHIIAGNVATVSGFIRLQKAGANGIRAGIASGAICSTAIETGFGVPILTNIIDMAKYKNKNTWLIADGGCKATGDIAKAVYFGADFVMMGKMLASTDLACGSCYNKNKEKLKSNIKIESDEDYFACVYPHQFEEKIQKAIELDGDNSTKFQQLCKKNLVCYKEYHGLASRQARKNVLSYASVEGVSGLIKYTCRTQQFIDDTYLRLQASLSYGGSKDWNQFRKKVRACKRSQAGIIAADTHLDITTDK